MDPMSTPPATVDLDKIIHGLKSFALPCESDIELLCAQAMLIMSHEQNARHVPLPVSVVGRIHGHYDDLLEIFDVVGHVPDINYIFLGNYVNKGPYGVETILLLLCLKVRHPDSVTLLRGTHDTRKHTKVYGFRDECCHKFGSESVWRLCTDVFDQLCLCAVVDNSVLCVHGGLSPSLDTISHIQALQRATEPPDVGPLCDLRWSEPDDDVNGWGISHRGRGYVFGIDVADQFLYSNQLELIVTGHRLFSSGTGHAYCLGQLLLLLGFPNDKNLGLPGAVLTIGSDGVVGIATIQPRPPLRRKGAWRGGGDWNSSVLSWSAWFESRDGDAEGHQSVDRAVSSASSEGGGSPNEPLPPAV